MHMHLLSSRSPQGPFESKGLRPFDLGFTTLNGSYGAVARSYCPCLDATGGGSDSARSSTGPVCRLKLSAQLIRPTWL